MKYFDGFGFSGYRSFNDEIVRIGPLSKINFFIGQNNSGKSNVINFLSNHFFEYFNGDSSRDNRKKYKDIDYHNFDKNLKPRVSYAINRECVEEYIKELIPSKIQNEYITELYDYIKKLYFSPFFELNKQIWFDFERTSQGSTTAVMNQNIDKHSIDQFKQILNHNEWNRFWGILTNQRGGGINDWVKESLDKIIVKPGVREVITIPGIRKVEKDSAIPDDFYSGHGLIVELSKLQHPDLANQEKRKLFLQINKFIKNVLENEAAEIEIPYDLNTILVHMNDKTLPLESLGMGIHEVVIIAAAATVSVNKIVCIEEPEIHMHPLLQKKLIAYLNNHTENQYFITTHSTHIIDLPDSSIFHVTYNGKNSQIFHVEKTTERSQICNDLGYKSSDIMQSNVVIWVEGPSDRIYLNFWLRNKRPSFVEGIHYSIMFFGGKSFSNVSGLDVEEINNNVDDLISLRALNRNSVIIFDSDRPNKNHRNYSDTKKRLRDEFDTGPGFAWITSGREIENYLNYEALVHSIKSVHPNINFEFKDDDYRNHLTYINSSGQKSSADKVRVAKHYTGNNKPDFSRMDLEDRIEMLCKFIEDSNK